jgi:hypothetical protein
MLHSRARMNRIAALLVVSACASQSMDRQDPSGGGGKADSDGPTLTFAADFTQSASGPLVAGGTMQIDYALDRLTDCRAQSNGSDQWGVAGWAQFDGGTPVTFAVSRISGGTTVPVLASVDIPRGAHHVAMWFTETNVYGCNAYDSNEGANYGFDIQANSGAVVLDFAADFTMSQSGTVHAGSTVILHYDPSRLQQCAASSGGHAAWGITGHYQADGGTVHDVLVSQASGTDVVAADPAITVPRGSDLALWFEASSVYGCDAIDSAYGANYHVAIQ